jgi:hypothetical protein
MRPSNGTVLIIAIMAGLILAGTLYWVTTGRPSPLCGGCYNYNAPGCPVGPCPGREGLNIESSQVNSSTNVTLSIRNTGAMGLSLVAYAVKDSIGNQYTRMNWTGPYLTPDQVVSINFMIDGTAFTFQSRNTYSVVVTSARNNLFSFTITA